MEVTILLNPFGKLYSLGMSFFYILGMSWNRLLEDAAIKH